MFELIFCDKINVYQEFEKAVARHICGSFEIKRMARFFVNAQALPAAVAKLSAEK